MNRISQIFRHWTFRKPLPLNSSNDSENETQTTTDQMGYDQIVEKALSANDPRQVIRATLALVAEKGLPGSHHIYLTFLTNYPGVAIPEWLLQRYQTRTTVVLQYQFSDLDVNEKAFAVTLIFDDTPERLFIPYDAVTMFGDPSVRVGMAFSEETGKLTTLLVGARERTSSPA